MEAVRMAKPQPPIETEDVGKGQAMKLWDPIRSLWVDPTPEERVRQKWIRLMVEDLLFPKGLLSVEKDLASLPHLSLRTAIDPERRLDLLSLLRRNAIDMKNPVQMIIFMHGTTG